MAREAERLLEGTGWLPEPLRLPQADDEVQPGEEVADLPDFLATGEAGDHEPAAIAAE